MKTLKNIKKGVWYRFFSYYRKNIVNGYQTYAKLIRKYGDDTTILKTAGGTGDVYLSGLYYKNYLKKHHLIAPTVFTVIHESGKKVAELFDIDNIEIIDYKERRNIVNLAIFAGFDQVNLQIIHHHPASLYTSILMQMETLHDLCSLDILKAAIYKDILPEGTPQFVEDRAFIRGLFQKYHLFPRKTVLLAPHATSMEKLPMRFWKTLVDRKSINYTNE